MRAVRLLSSCLFAAVVLWSCYVFASNVFVLCHESILI